MASQHSERGDEYEPIQDFTSDPFVVRREPIKELINTFSELYIDSEEENAAVDDAEDIDDVDPFPPPPPEMVERSELTPNASIAEQVRQLMGQVTTLETQVEACVKKVNDRFSQFEIESKCRKVEEKLTYRIERECERIQQRLELNIRDLGKSMVDCLKRRDIQIDSKFKSLIPSTSTPIQPSPSPCVPPPIHKVKNQTYQLQQSHTHLTSTGNTTAINSQPPVKLEFPSFGSSDDPVAFIEQCEEYLAIRPLSDCEMLASLTSVLKDTAKDWWLAERRNVHTWQQFKDVFLCSFLSEDYEDEAARRLIERKQGAQESIRDFAFHYRALCLRWKRDMPEREILQAILRNCNPRLASLLRGSVQNVAEVVRIGTQIERDFGEAKRYWSNVNTEYQKKKVQLNKDSGPKPSLASTRVVQGVQQSVQPQFKMITLPIVLHNRFFQAIVDTGSTLSLIQESCWKQLHHQEQWKSSKGQTFMLANGQMQTAIGMSECECDLQGKQLKLTLYVMKDSDLTVPIILGMDFLIASGIVLDFKNTQYSLPSNDEDSVEIFPFYFLNHLLHLLCSSILPYLFQIYLKNFHNLSDS